MIKLKRIHTKYTGKVFYNGEYIGYFHNNMELLDLRLQIAKQVAVGYTCVFDVTPDMVCVLDDGGGITNHPDGLGEVTRYTREIRNLQLNDHRNQ